MDCFTAPQSGRCTHDRGAMSGDVVNLRMARKVRARELAQATATANRAKFGEAKPARTARKIETARAERALDGARREPD